MAKQIVYDKSFLVRVTEQELEQLRTRANQLGLDQSKYIRKLVNDDISGMKTVPTPEDLSNSAFTIQTLQEQIQTLTHLVKDLQDQLSKLTYSNGIKKQIQNGIAEEKEKQIEEMQNTATLISALIQAGKKLKLNAIVSEWNIEPEKILKIVSQLPDKIRYDPQNNTLEWIT